MHRLGGMKEKGRRPCGTQSPRRLPPDVTGLADAARNHSARTFYDPTHCLVKPSVQPIGEVGERLCFRLKHPTAMVQVQIPPPERIVLPNSDATHWTATVAVSLLMSWIGLVSTRSSPTNE